MAGLTDQAPVRSSGDPGAQWVLGMYVIAIKRPAAGRGSPGQALAVS